MSVDSSPEPERVDDQDDYEVSCETCQDGDQTGDHEDVSCAGDHDEDQTGDYENDNRKELKSFEQELRDIDFAFADTQVDQPVNQKVDQQLDEKRNWD